ncbi:MAG TPA: hypothetical protein VIL52_05545 [Bacteroidota bacterium]
MTRTNAVLLLLGTSIALVLLLLTQTISLVTAGLFFAFALVFLGFLSRGFTNATPNKGTKQ